MTIKVGELFKINSGGWCKVIAYKDCFNVTIEHIDEHAHQAVVVAQLLRKGTIRNPYRKSYYGVGFLGVGRHLSILNGNKTKAVITWEGMLQRCYCPRYQKYKPTYKGCSVHPDWHNFQVFAEWYNNQEYNGEGYQLDKDILYPENKIYSKDTCCLVPREVNSLVSIKRSKYGSNLPTGVHYVKSRKKYTTSVGTGEDRRRFGHYDCPYEAHKIYVREKIKMVRIKAVQYKNQVSDNVFTALSNYSLKIESQSGVQENEN